MISGLWGKKIGMTQVFSSGNKVVPVTVIDTAHWFVTQIKTEEKDGYNAIQLGRVRKKFEGKPFDAAWLKKPSAYFLHIKEVRQKDPVQNREVGQAANLVAELEKGQTFDVFGTTKGYGFQGGVKRHGFAGGPASHGSDFKRRPGSMSYTRGRGRVMKGKKLPGHMGVLSRVMKKLEIIDIEPNSQLVLVKGSVPGHAGSLVFMRNAGAQ